MAALAFSAYGIHWFAIGWNRYRSSDPRPNAGMCIAFMTISAMGATVFRDRREYTRMWQEKVEAYTQATMAAASDARLRRGRAGTDPGAPSGARKPGGCLEGEPTKQRKPLEDSSFDQS